METEVVENYIDTEHGSGSGADFHREERKPDRIYGKNVEHS